MEESWVVIRNCLRIEEALIVRSSLEAAGFNVLLPEEYLLGSNPHYGIAVGGARVMVPTSECDRAAAFLEDMENCAPPGGVESNEDNP